MAKKKAKPKTEKEKVLDQLERQINRVNRLIKEYKKLRNEK